jgi:hypothetical protein
MTVRPFISYAREDRDVAVRLRNDLVHLGAAPWIDVVDLIPGEDWQLAISRALRQSSHFLALLSQNSVTKRGYVQKEVREALAILDQLPPDAVFLIPVRLDDAEPIHDRLRNLHRVDLFTGYDTALSQIARGLGLNVDRRDADTREARSRGNGQEARPLLVELHVGELVDRDVGATPKFIFKVVNPNLRPVTVCGAGIEARAAGISVPAIKPETLWYPSRIALARELSDGQRLDFVESVDFFETKLRERSIEPPMEIIGYVTDAFGNHHESKPTTYIRPQTAG